MPLEQYPTRRHPADELTDPNLHEEIELLGEVIAATAGRDRRLSSSEVDRALGVGSSGHGPGSPKARYAARSASRGTSARARLSA